MNLSRLFLLLACGGALNWCMGSVLFSKSLLAANSIRTDSHDPSITSAATLSTPKIVMSAIQSVSDLDMFKYPVVVLVESRLNHRAKISFAMPTSDRITKNGRKMVMMLCVVTLRDNGDVETRRVYGKLTPLERTERGRLQSHAQNRRIRNACGYLITNAKLPSAFEVRSRNTQSSDFIEISWVPYKPGGSLLFGFTKDNKVKSVTKGA
jgi:hypothetical protein